MNEQKRSLVTGTTLNLSQTVIRKLQLKTLFCALSSSCISTTTFLGRVTSQECGEFKVTGDTTSDWLNFQCVCGTKPMIGYTELSTGHQQQCYEIYILF